MLAWLRRLSPMVVVAICALTAIAALAKGTGGPLTGTWRGYIVGQPGSHIKRRRIVIVVNSKETGGNWSVSATCHGPLTLDSISNGYHHYVRRLAKGATCTGGDVDCLKRVAANVYDAVTSHVGGEYDMSGTLHRLRRK